MKIVALDRYTLNPGDLSWGTLEELGELTVYDRNDEKEIIARLEGAEIVLTNETPISKATLEACPGIKYIGVLATEYNVVDIETVGQKGIPVSNISTYGTDSVGQFAIVLLLEICHHIGEHSDTVLRGDWAKDEFCLNSRKREKRGP